MKIKTTCKDCIFAQWEESGNGEKLYQVGCSLGRLKKFQKICPDKVHYITDNDNQEYYEIDRICNYCRNGDWAEKHGPNNLTEILKKETVPKIDFIILGEDVEKSILSVKSVLQQTVKPHCIFVISKNRELCPELSRFLKKNSNGIKYKVSYVFDKKLDEDKVVNEAVRQCKGSMYTLLADGDSVKEDLISKIDHYLNDLLKPVLVVYNQDGSITGFTASRRLHEMLGGNGKRTLIDKAQQLSEEQNRQDMLVSWEEIYNNA